MKIILIGILALLGWSVLSTHIYVCNIKGLCADPLFVQVPTVSQKDSITTDISKNTPAPEKLSIPDSVIVHFAFDKSDFQPDSQIEKYFIESKAFLNRNSQARLSIIGFADAIGSEEYNKALGYRRAQTMQNYFEDRGILAGKILISSLGERNPLDDNNSTSGRANNRRTQITIKN
jgi:outer membrane protein OmpA-like peptidoglycan-associated protein